MHEKDNQGLTLSIIVLIPQPSKLPVGKLVSCTNGVVISSNVQRYHFRDGILQFALCSDAGRNHHVLHLFLLAPLHVRRFVPRGEERGEMAVFTGYLKLQLITQDNARKLVS